MKRRAPLALLLSLTAVALLAGGESAAAAPELCDNTYGGDVISAKKVGCKKARRVVRKWGHRYKSDGQVNRTVLGFECRGSNSPSEGLTVRCRRGEARIRFYANVP